MRNFRVVSYSFPNGSCAAYCPETSPLVPLYAHDPRQLHAILQGNPDSDRALQRLFGNRLVERGAVPFRKNRLLLQDGQAQAAVAS